MKLIHLRVTGLRVEAEINCIWRYKINLEVHTFGMSSTTPTLWCRGYIRPSSKEYLRYVITATLAQHKIIFSRDTGFNSTDYFW